MRLTEYWWFVGLLAGAVFMFLCFWCGRTQVRRIKCRVISTRERDNRMLGLMLLGSAGMIGYVVMEVIWNGWLLGSWLMTLALTPAAMVLIVLAGVVFWAIGDWSVREAARKYMAQCQKERGGGRCDCERCDVFDK